MAIKCWKLRFKDFSIIFFPSSFIGIYKNLQNGRFFFHTFELLATEKKLYILICIFKHSFNNNFLLFSGYSNFSQNTLHTHNILKNPTTLSKIHSFTWLFRVKHIIWFHCDISYGWHDKDEHKLRCIRAHNLKFKFYSSVAGLFGKNTHKATRRKEINQIIRICILTAVFFFWGGFGQIFLNKYSKSIIQKSKQSFIARLYKNFYSHVACSYRNALPFDWWRCCVGDTKAISEILT